MAITLDALERQGWFLSEQGLQTVKEQCENSESTTLEEFIQVAKDTDLRDITDKGFRKGDLTKLSQLPSPLVLQVLQIQNIAVPSVQHVEKPRLLRVTFTDGSKKKWIGAEIDGQVDSLSLHTPPGTKFLVTRPIDICEQVLILGPGKIVSIGGYVQDMVQAWKAGKQFIKRSKGNTSSTEDMPPPFVPFKVKITKPKDSSPAKVQPDIVTTKDDDTKKISSKSKKHKQKGDKNENVDNEKTIKSNIHKATSKPKKNKHDKVPISTSTSDSPLPAPKATDDSHDLRKKNKSKKAIDIPSTSSPLLASKTGSKASEPQGGKKDIPCNEQKMDSASKDNKKKDLTKKGSKKDSIKKETNNSKDPKHNPQHGNSSIKQSKKSNQRVDKQQQRKQLSSSFESGSIQSPLPNKAPNVSTAVDTTGISQLSAASKPFIPSSAINHSRSSEQPQQAEQSGARSPASSGSQNRGGGRGRGGGYRGRGRGRGRGKEQSASP